MRSKMLATDQQAAVLASMVADGATLNEIGRAIGVSRATVRAWIDRYELAELYYALPRRGMRQHERSVGRVMKSRIEHGILNGETLQSIANAVGVTRERIRQIIDEMGRERERLNAKQLRQIGRRYAAIEAWLNGPGQSLNRAAQYLAARGVVVEWELAAERDYVLPYIGGRRLRAVYARLIYPNGKNKRPIWQWRCNDREAFYFVVVDHRRLFYAPRKRGWVYVPFNPALESRAMMRWAA